MARVDKELPLTDLFFAMENECNIKIRASPTTVDQTPPLVAQEESSPHQEKAQVVFNTPHRPRRRMEDGKMVCGATHSFTTPHSTQQLLPFTPTGRRGRVLENVLPLPVQATTHHGGHCGELVCSLLPRHGGAEMLLQQVEMVCGSVLTSPLGYEEGSEVVCGGVGWGRTAQTPPHQTSKTTVPSSVVWNNQGAIGTLQNTTHHYIPQLLPSLRETTTPNTPVAGNTHFSYECHSLEEYWPKSGIPREAVGDS